jgi:hypothetical protein
MRNSLLVGSLLGAMLVFNTCQCSTPQMGSGGGGSATGGGSGTGGGGGGGGSGMGGGGAQATATCSGLVVDGAHSALPGVAVSIGGANGTSGSDGRFSITVMNPSAGGAVSFHLDGYLPFTRQIDLEAGAMADVLAVLYPQAAAQQLDATAGGTITGARGAAVTFPPMSLVDPAGNTVSGMVDVRLTPLDPSDDAQLAEYPAGLNAKKKDGTTGVLTTYGVMDIDVRKNGSKLNVKSGQMLAALIPGPSLGTAPDLAGTWSLDETTGVWLEEGTATWDSASNLYALSLPHLSEWNIDVLNLPGCIHGRLVDKMMKPIGWAAIEAHEDGNHANLGGAYSFNDGTFCVLMMPSGSTTLNIFLHPTAVPVEPPYTFHVVGPTHTVSSPIFNCTDPQECTQLNDLVIDPTRNPDGGLPDGGTGYLPDGGVPPIPPCALTSADGGVADAGPLSPCMQQLAQIFTCFDASGSCMQKETGSMTIEDDYGTGARSVFTISSGSVLGTYISPGGATCGTMGATSGGSPSISDTMGHTWTFLTSSHQVICPDGSTESVPMSQEVAVTSCAGGFGPSAQCGQQKPIGGSCNTDADCSFSAPLCCDGKAGKLCETMDVCPTYQSMGCGSDADCPGGKCCSTTAFPLCIPTTTCPP